MVYINKQLFVALVSAYRYEGTKVNEEVAKSEAKIVFEALKNADKKNPLLDDDVVTILAIRSKLHIMSLFQHYKKISANSIDVVSFQTKACVIILISINLFLLPLMA